MQRGLHDGHVLHACIGVFDCLYDIHREGRLGEKVCQEVYDVETCETMTKA